MNSQPSAREMLNHLKQKYGLGLVSQEAVAGPGNAQVWTCVWILTVLNGQVEIGRADALSKASAKEASALYAVQWLLASGYKF